MESIGYLCECFILNKNGIFKSSCDSPNSDCSLTCLFFTSPSQPHHPHTLTSPYPHVTFTPSHHPHTLTSPSHPHVTFTPSRHLHTLTSPSHSRHLHTLTSPAHPHIMHLRTLTSPSHPHTLTLTCYTYSTVSLLYVPRIPLSIGYPWSLR